jgi:hypothetical protein
MSQLLVSNHGIGAATMQAKGGNVAALASRARGLANADGSTQVKGAAFGPLFLCMTRTARLARRIIEWF